MMASELHGKYLIVSRPEYKYALEAWSAYATIVWREEDSRSFNYRIFQNLERGFETEKEAETFGMTLARAWIEREL
jgi:hypothetical protein